jgi:predicted transcriptional regulator
MSAPPTQRYFALPQGIIRTMNTLTIKIPSELEQEIVQASQREHLSKSELVRRALVAYVNQHKAGVHNKSALEQAGDLVGCFSGGPSDLSSNPRHLDAFGRV